MPESEAWSVCTQALVYAVLTPGRRKVPESEAWSVCTQALVYGILPPGRRKVPESEAWSVLLVDDVKICHLL